MRGHGVADEFVAFMIDVNDIAGEEARDAPLPGLFKERDEVEARDVGGLCDSTHRRLIRQTPCRLIEQLPLVGPDDQDHFALTLLAELDHRVQVVGEVFETDSRGPAHVGIEIILSRLFGPTGFVVGRLLLS